MSQIRNECNKGKKNTLVKKTCPECISGFFVFQILSMIIDGDQMENFPNGLMAIF